MKLLPARPLERVKAGKSLTSFVLACFTSVPLP